MNLSDLFTIPRARDPRRVALHFAPSEGEPSALTYEELDRRVAGVARGLTGRRVARGDRVAFYLGNRPEQVIAHLALLRLGAVTVPINLAYRRREIAHILADAEPRLLLTETQGLPVVEELADDERHSLEDVLLAEELLTEELPAAGATGPVGETPKPPVAGHELALLLYTSGTTGRSKGAMLSHDNLLATVCSLLAAWGWQATDELLLSLPLFHMHGLVVGLYCALASGATVRLAPRFDAERTAAQLASGEGTLFFGVPTMYVRLVEALRRAGAPELPRVRLCCSGSAPLAPETFAAFRELTGHAILERYGMTETGMNLSNPLVGARRPGTVGVPLPGVSMRIVDGAGQEVPDGSEGTLLIRGSNVFHGYWRDPGKTAESFHLDEAGRRWFRTGDLARRDPETGYVTLLGRESELILSGGLNIYPREVEEVVAAFPGIQEVAVVGEPHAEWGEVPVAFVVTSEELDAEALAAHCRQELAAFKVPKAFRCVEALPRNALGKVQKHLLRPEAEARP